MNQTVQVELVDLPRVELEESGTHVFEQCSQLALVISGDQLSRGTTIGLVRRTALCVAPSDHSRKLQPGTTAREPAYSDAATADARPSFPDTSASGRTVPIKLSSSRRATQRRVSGWDDRARPPAA
jgi:hypothetical protein